MDVAVGIHIAVFRSADRLDRRKIFASFCENFDKGINIARFPCRPYVDFGTILESESNKFLCARSEDTPHLRSFTFTVITAHVIHDETIAFIDDSIDTNFRPDTKFVIILNVVGADKCRIEIEDS
jgi:hypothetical protein